MKLRSSKFAVPHCHYDLCKQPFVLRIFLMRRINLSGICVNAFSECLLTVFVMAFVRPSIN